MSRTASSNCASSRERYATVRAAILAVLVFAAHDDVRLDSAAVDRAPRRSQIARRRQLDGAAFAERHDGLHGALAVGGFADDARAAVILQRAGDDLRRRSRGGVDEHDHRHRFERIAGDGRLLELGLADASRAADDDAAGEERIGDAHGRSRASRPGCCADRAPGRAARRARRLRSSHAPPARDPPPCFPRTTTNAGRRDRCPGTRCAPS